MSLVTEVLLASGVALLLTAIAFTRFAGQRVTSRARRARDDQGPDALPEQ